MFGRKPEIRIASEASRSDQFETNSNVVDLTLLYINPKSVIPVPISIGINSSGNPGCKNWIPGQARNDKKGIENDFYYSN